MYISPLTRKNINVDLMLTLIAKAKGEDTEIRHWHLPKSLVSYCLACNATGESTPGEDNANWIDQHRASHVTDIHKMIKADVWPTPQRQFQRWCDHTDTVPHVLLFDVPCVRWCIIRILNLAVMSFLHPDVVAAAIKRAAEDEMFCDALDAAAAVPRGISTLLENQF